MPIRTGQGLKRVANVSAISWDLSPSSATKMTAKLTAVATRKPSIRCPSRLCGRDGTQGDLDPAEDAARVEGLVRLDEAAWPDARARQYVDHGVADYSPSLRRAYPAG